MKQQNSTFPTDILLALVIGATIVLLLAAGENQGIAPDLIRTLLWPGLRLAQATDHGTHDIGVMLVAMGDIIVYGLVSFVVLRVLRTIFK
jgi:hypothetical protein